MRRLGARLDALVGMLLLVVVTWSGCQQPQSAHEVFVERVIPVLEARCSAPSCHGVPRDAEALGWVVDWNLFNFHVDGEGRIVDHAQAYHAALRAIDTVDAPEFSPLLRKPLAVVYGGLPHYGKDNFLSPQDPGYRAIYDWIALEDEGGEDPLPLTALERQFAETVEPILVGAACTNGNCHGLRAGVPLRLDGGSDGVRSIAASRANYEEAVSMLALDGDALQSRLLRKALPLHAGGITHKGGNSAFFSGPADPRVAPITAWACAERQARTGAPCTSKVDPPAEGFVFVRGPVEAQGFFELDVFIPGSDLLFAPWTSPALVPGPLESLTAALHTSPVDIRDPAVHHDGTKLLFAMRRSPDEGHAIWEMDLLTREARPLTTAGGAMPGGGMHTDRDPTYGPDGHVWFVSTRAGVVADGGGQLDADVYELDPTTGEIRRRTHTLHIERKPVFFAIGAEAGGEISFSALRRAIAPQARAHIFRFPPNLATEYHQHFGITPPETVFFDMRELPDGRYATVIGDLGSVWEGGRLGIVDRNFGPELNERAASPDPSLPFYAPPLSRLDPSATAQGVTGGLYRDPVALSDGRILAAYAPGPIDLSDPAAPVELRIQLLTLAESLLGSGAELVDSATLVAEPGVSLYDPEPVARRAPARLDEEPHWDPTADHAVIRHQGMSTIDALLGNLYPSGDKLPDEAFHFVRVVEAVPQFPSAWAPVPPEQTRHGQAGATTLSLAPNAPTRVLCELPLAADGTFHAAVPPRVPFRLQGLDERRMARGTMHNRWFDALPGQVVPQGVAVHDGGAYAAQCAACHGAQDGESDHAFVEPDILTTASLTLSRYEGGNPRKPLPPPVCGEDTRLEVDYLRDVQPLLERACAGGGCHSGADPAAGLSLSPTPTTWYSDAYESLLAPGVGSGDGRKYVAADTGSAFRSFVLEKVTGVELGAPRVLETPGIPHPSGGPTGGGQALSDEEVLLLVRWIDLGASFRVSAPGGGKAP